MVVQLRSHTWSWPASTWPSLCLVHDVELDTSQRMSWLWQWSQPTTAKTSDGNLRQREPAIANSSYEDKNPEMKFRSSTCELLCIVWGRQHTILIREIPTCKMTKWLKSLLVHCVHLEGNHHCPGEHVSYYQRWLLIWEPSCLLWWEHVICRSDIPKRSGSVNQPSSSSSLCLTLLQYLFIWQFKDVASVCHLWFRCPLLHHLLAPHLNLRAQQQQQGDQLIQKWNCLHLAFILVLALDGVMVHPELVTLA